MKLSQFTMRDLLLSTALVAIGMALIAIVDKSEPATLVIAWVLLGLWYLGGALIGAGVFRLVRRPVLGAALGLAIQVAAAIAYSILVS